MLQEWPLAVWWIENINANNLEWPDNEITNSCVSCGKPGLQRNAGAAQRRVPMKAQTPRGLAAIVAALSIIGPFTVDTYLPAFPAMANGLGATPVQLQQTLSFYLAPFAFMILWHGALADALGRRRVLLAALAVYVAASLFCAMAGSIEMLLLGRVLQGLSAGAGMVIARAVVRDLLEGPAAQRLIAQAGMMFAVGPVLAPLVGGWILA